MSLQDIKQMLFCIKNLHDGETMARRIIDISDLRVKRQKLNLSKDADFRCAHNLLQQLNINKTQMS